MKLTVKQLKRVIKEAVEGPIPLVKCAGYDHHSQVMINMSHVEHYFEQFFPRFWKTAEQFGMPKTMGNTLTVYCRDKDDVELVVNEAQEILFHIMPGFEFGPPPDGAPFGFTIFRSAEDSSPE